MCKCKEIGSETRKSIGWIFGICWVLLSQCAPNTGVRTTHHDLKAESRSGLRRKRVSGLIPYYYKKWFLACIFDRHAIIFQLSPLFIVLCVV